MLEAAAQSDVRSSQDIFNFLDSISVDRAEGAALDKIAADENITRTPTSPSSGNVNFSDTSFTKISTTIYQGGSAPNIGTTALKVTNASSFPSKGSIYLGRGTINYEGPISYNSSGSNPPVNNGSYWTVTLDTGTTKFHNLGESVILAQGGNRTIPAGTIVQTPQGNISNAVQFSTLYTATLLDGENLLQNIPVLAQSAGVIGNVPAASISQVVSAPYVGAAVTNPLPFTNGQAEQDDVSLRETIKDARQSRAKGTILALTTNVQGVTSSFDNKTVVSSAVLTAEGQTPTLIIDDGTGYEEATAGVPQETLMDSALGGEQIFQLSSQRPIAKAFVTTNNVVPFVLSAGATLAVSVGGTITSHSFSSSEFQSISNATAFEVVSAINGNPSLNFNARTANNATQVSIFARNVDTNEDIQVLSPSSGLIDANKALAFSNTHAYTLGLYKNDKLLYKDGKIAEVQSNAQALWSPTITDGDTLIIEIDGTPTQTVTIHNADFINNNTGFTTVNTNNTLSSWATVLQFKIIGVTVTASNGVLTITSNAGNTGRAAINITGGTLITKGMFSFPANQTSLSSQGANNDYTFNRNTGQLKLTDPLVIGDSLSAATSNSNAYVQSQVISSSSVTLASTANLWIAVDGGASILTTGVNGATSFTITIPVGTTNRARYTAANGTFGPIGTTALTGGYIRPGDWVVIWDPSFTDKGAFRIADVDNVSGNWSYFDVERGTITTQVSIAPSSSGMVFVRTNNQLENIQIPSGIYSLTALASQINTSIVGALSSVFRNTQLRIQTDTLGSNGDVMLVTADIQGQLLLLQAATLYQNSPSYFAVAESANSEVGTPGFQWTTVATVPSSTTFTPTNTSLTLRSGDMITFRKRLNIYSPSFLREWGNNASDYTPVFSIAGNTITPRPTITSTERLVNDRFYAASPYSTNYDDNLAIVLDNDPVNKNYNVNLFRNIKPANGASYGSTFNVLDVDNGNVALTNAFGTSSSLFNDFKLSMKARGKSHSNTLETNKTILWRFARYGSTGNNATVQYTWPSAPSQGFGISTDTVNGTANIYVSLPSGAANTGLGLQGNHSFVVASNTTYTANTGNVSRTSNFVTVTLAASGVTNTNNLVFGDYVYQITDDPSAGFRKGPKAINSSTGNTFSYNETGSNGTSDTPIQFQITKKPAGQAFQVTGLTSTGTSITATVSAGGVPPPGFSIGQTVYFNPGHYDPGSNITVAAGAKVITNLGNNTVTWNESTTSGTASLISGINYYVSSGESVKTTLIYFRAEVAVGNLSKAAGSNIVNATMNTTALISQHNYQVGQVVYISPGETNFPSGPKIITAVGTTTFSYIDSVTNPGPGTQNNTTVEYFAPTSTNPNFTGGGNPVTAGEVVHIDPATSLDSAITGNYQVFLPSSTQFSFTNADTNYAGNAVPKPINSPNNLVFYPINTGLSTAANVVSFINGNATAQNVVSATLVPNNGGGTNNGSGQITQSTLQEFLSTVSNASINGSGFLSVPYWSFFDGTNWIQSSTLSVGVSTLTLKDPVSGELTANADFSNENMRLIPVTATNMVNYLSNPGTSGLYSNATINRSSDGKKVQVISNTIGSGGAVEVSGGTGNLTTASVFGAGQTISSTGYSVVTIPASQIQGFGGNQWVSVQGTNTVQKNTPWGGTDTMAILTTGTGGAGGNAQTGEFLIQFDNSITPVNLIQLINTANTYQIERQGRFMAYVDNSSSPTTLSGNIAEGDWVYIRSTTMNPSNTGTRQVVRVDPATHTFWVENTSGVEEIVTLSTGTNDFIKFLKYDSVMPGDTFVINTNIFGSRNIGTYTVSRLSENPAAATTYQPTPGTGTTQNEFFVFSNTMSTVSATTLGSNYIFVRAVEGTPIRLIKKIRAINLNGGNSNYYDMVFDTNSYASKMSTSAGSIVTALDKLGFTSDTIVGLNGYNYNTGLLAEVNKVVYGDETNPTVYPGVAAAGAIINIQGPLVKRIQVSLEIRFRTGVSIQDISDRIKSSVAATINSTAVGQSIPISDIVSAASAIDGVLSVVILSPTYNSSNDLITLQPQEKAEVLNIETDILVSVAGT